MQIRFNQLKIQSLADFREIRSYNQTKYGKVAFCLHIPTRAFVVLKYRITSELSTSESSQEAKIYLQLGPHAYISVFYGFKYLDKRSIIALRYYPLGDLKQQITKHAWYLLYHIAKALDHIHSKGFIFCDLKPANIVLEEEIYTETLACDMPFIDEDDISRSCNVNFILTDFGHTQFSQKQHKTSQLRQRQTPEKSKFSSQNDKICNVFAAKKIENSFNQGRSDGEKVSAGQFYSVSRSPQRQFTTLEVMNFELTKCGTPAYQSTEQRRGLFNEKTDIYSLGLVVIEMLFLKKYSDVRDFEFETIEVNLRQFLMKMLQDEVSRPSSEDIVQRAFSALHQLKCVNGGAIKNSSELLQDRMEQMQETEFENSRSIVNITNRASSSQCYSISSLSQKSDRSLSQFSQTLTDISENYSDKMVDVIGKQSIPSPVREELIQSQRFKQKSSKNIWEWDVEKENVIEPKQDCVEGTILQEFGLQAQLRRNEEAQERYKALHQPKREKSPTRKYVETGGGGYTIKSTFRHFPKPTSKSTVPVFTQIFGK